MAIDCSMYTVDFYTVPDIMIGYNIMVGRTLFQTWAELWVNPQSMTVICVGAEHQLMFIDISGDELDIGDKTYSHAIHELIDSCYPFC